MSGDTYPVDLGPVADDLREALALVEKISKLPAPTSGDRKERTSAQAEITRQLLYLSHVCDRARIATLDEYHATRGFFPGN